MKIAASVLGAMTPKDIHDCAQAAIRCARSLDDADRELAGDWWRALTKQLADALVHFGVNAPLPDEPETDIRTDTIGLGSWDLRHVAALVCLFRDDGTRTDADRALWADLLASLAMYVRQPMQETDLGDVLAVIGGESPVRPHSGLWTADTASAIAELDAEG